jgi:5-methyltetrahydropteroyltriglutamate--homocysteine methyltransferase
MKHSTERILTTHAGTLPHPPEFDDASDEQQDDGEAYATVLRNSVAAVVEKQVRIGIDVPNDGELGKAGPNRAASWASYINDRLAGYERKPVSDPLNVMQVSQDRRDFPRYYEEAQRAGTLWYRPFNPARTAESGGATANGMALVATKPVSYAGQALVQRDIDNFKAALVGKTVEDAFMPVVAPASIEPGHRNEYYASEEEYVYGLADAMSVEYKMIVDAGLLVQLDDAWIPALWDRMLPNIDFEQYRKHCQLRVEALNHALRDIPRDRIRYHICWGSWHGPHISDIPIAQLLPIVLQIKAQAFVFEAANVRHEHEYHAWEGVKLDDDTILIPGVVSHATNVVEHPELVAERILRYANIVGRENVMAGTDCGLGGRVHPDIAWAKLMALVEGARLASSKLWR